MPEHKIKLHVEVERYGQWSVEEIIYLPFVPQIGSFLSAKNVSGRVTDVIQSVSHLGDYDVQVRISK